MLEYYLKPITKNFFKFCTVSAESFLDFLIPQTCINCGVEIDKNLLCNSCLESIPMLRVPFCPICGRPTKKHKPCKYCKKAMYLDRGRAWLPFIPPVDKIIHYFKYRKMTKLARLLGQGMTGVIKSDFYLKKSEIIIPIPLFWWKKLRRGYNQAQLLADVISQECGIEVHPILKRTKNTKTQTKLTEDSRKDNVSNAFRLGANGVKDKTVLLIDDVLTTGATINECARVLKAAGAKKVYACVAAITPG